LLLVGNPPRGRKTTYTSFVLSFFLSIGKLVQ
jgi:hypothetical protein